jgi:hypothetical protein
MQQWYPRPLFRQCDQRPMLRANNYRCLQCNNVPYVPIVAAMYSNNVVGFPLLQQCVATMTPGYSDCLVPRKNATDRQI